MRKKIKSLWFPNFVSVLVVSLMANALLSLHIVSEEASVPFTVKSFVLDIIKAFFFGGGRQLLGANWFLRTLFFGLLLYEVTNRLLTRLNINEWMLKTAICLFFLTAGWLLTGQLGHGMYFNVLSVPILLEIGRGIKNSDLINRYRDMKYSTAYGLAFFAGLAVLSQFGSITMNYNVIVNPPFFLLCSLLGFFLCVSAGDLIFKYGGKLKEFIAYMGKNSLVIMLIHFVSFKGVTFLQVVLFGDSIEMLTSYPVYVSSNGWWVVYSAAGIGIPCLVTLLWGKLKERLVKIK